MKFGDDSTIDIKGISKIHDTPPYIINVFYVPKLKSNLLSIRQLIEKSYKINLKNNIYKIEDDKSQIIITI